MDTKEIDVTASTIAALLGPPKQAVPIEKPELEKVLTKPITIGQILGGLIISSQRDQIEVVAQANKVNVRDLSGRQDSFCPHLFRKGF